MAEDLGDKTEAPTPRRRQESREKGQVAKSQDLSAGALLLGGLITLEVFGGDVVRRISNLMAGLIGGGGSAADASQLIPTAVQTAKEVAGILWPLLLAAVILSLVIQYFQVGWLLSPTPLKPSLDKLNPITGFRRLFSTRSAVQLLQSVGKFLAVGAVGYLTVAQLLNPIVSVSRLDIAQLMGLAAELVFKLCLRMAMLLVILGILDYVYQRYRHEKELRMTKEEVKEELRRMEGDPMLKRRRREIQFQMSLHRIRSALSKADVVITNPTELAVAIQYDSERMNAPKVAAKGEKYMAERIRTMAVELGIPIVQRKPLARALYSTVRVGQEIPESLYKAVAEVLAYVYQLAGRKVRPAHRAAGSLPTTPSPLP